MHLTLLLTQVKELIMCRNYLLYRALKAFHLLRFCQVLLFSHPTPPGFQSRAFAIFKPYVSLYIKGEVKDNDIKKENEWEKTCE